MSEAFTMPILGTKPKERFTWTPTKAHRGQADLNHGQTLERLRARGGLSWCELYCVLAGVGLFSIRHNDENKVRCKSWLLNAHPQKARPDVD